VHCTVNNSVSCARGQFLATVCAKGKIVSERYQERMRFDDDVAVLIRLMDDFSAGSWILQQLPVVKFNEFGGWRRIKEQNASKLKRAQGDLSAVF